MTVFYPEYKTQRRPWRAVNPEAIRKPLEVPRQTRHLQHVRSAASVLGLVLGRLACMTIAVLCCGCVTVTVPRIPFLESAQSQNKAECRECNLGQPSMACDCNEQIQSNVVVSHTRTMTEAHDHAGGRVAQALESSQAGFAEHVQTGPVSANSGGEWAPTQQAISLPYPDTPRLHSVPPITEGCESEVPNAAAVSEIENQLSELTMRMQELEQQRVQDQLTIKRLRESQKTEAHDRTVLQEEVSQWKDSVGDLMSRIQTQQQNDIDSLNAISKTLAGIAPVAADTQKGTTDAPQP